jgi:hypothetical protein
MEQITDYKQAKTIASSLEVNEEKTIKVTVASTFRKYLRDFSYGKEFTTKKVEKGIRVIRLK